MREENVPFRSPAAYVRTKALTIARSRHIRSMARARRQAHHNRISCRPQRCRRRRRRGASCMRRLRRVHMCVLLRLLLLRCGRGRGEGRWEARDLRGGSRRQIFNRVLKVHRPECPFRRPIGIGMIELQNKRHLITV